MTEGGKHAASPTMPDPRRNAYRPDLAAAELSGIVNAPRYVQGEIRIVGVSTAGLRDRPDETLGFSSELLFGERVRVLETAGGWSWLQAERDRYVGYVPASALEPPSGEATHKVSALGTIVYARDDIKSPMRLHLSLGSPLRVVERKELMSRIAPDGWVMNRHIWDIGRAARDFVEVAERFLGVPYLWGGRSRFGLDCSGLLQVAMEAAGLPCPRDSDMQRAEVGTEMPIPAGLEGLQRGDLLFWPGHVGIMSDAFTLLHANAHYMSVAAEPVPEAVARIAKAGSRLATIRRPRHLAAPLRT